MGSLDYKVCVFSSLVIRTKFFQGDCSNDLPPAVHANSYSLHLLFNHWHLKNLALLVDTLVFYCGFTLYFSSNNEFEVEHYFICLLSPGYSLFRCACSNLISLMVIWLLKKLICRHSFNTLESIWLKNILQVYFHTLLFAFILFYSVFSWT